MTKKELINWVRRKLGEPMVRVELHNSQIEDCMAMSRDEYMRWAVGGATNEVTFTIELSAGVSEYELPSGVTEVVKVRDYDSSMHGINTLFSAENYLYNQGVLSFLDNIGNYSMVDYHLALEFIDLLDRYFPSYYTTRYNKANNILSVRPTPEIDSSVGYLIIDSFMMAGTDQNTTGPIPEEVYNAMWDVSWVQKYTLACSKEILGLIRRKFENFTSIGNEGISLDGGDLISEGKEEKEKLEEEIKLDSYSEEGYGIVIG